MDRPNIFYNSINKQQIPSDGSQPPPYFGTQHPPPIIYTVRFSLRVDHMGYTGLYVGKHTVLHTYDIPVAHQRYLVAVDADDTVHDPSASLNPCQHYVADKYAAGPTQNNTLLATNDKRQHAPPVHRQRHTHALTHQPHRLV